MNLADLMVYIKNKYSDLDVDCGFDEYKKLGIWVNSNYRINRDANIVIDKVAHDLIGMVDNTKYEFDTITDRLNKTKNHRAYALLLFNKKIS